MAVNEYSLITLDEVKKFIGMEGGTSDTDDLLEDLINRVSALFESYIDRSILVRDYTEYSDGKGLSVLFPHQYPVTTISGIWDDYDWEWNDDDLIDSDNYRIVEDSYIVFKTVTLSNYSQNIKIIYTAGYTTTPLDLVQSCITEVSRMYKNKNQVDVTAITLSDGTVSFSSKDLLPLTITTLNKYKRLGTV